MVCFGALPLARLGRAHAPSKKKLRERESLSPLWRPRSTCARSPGTMQLPRVQARVRWSLRTVGGGVDSLAQQMEPKAYQNIKHQKKSQKVILAQSGTTGPIGLHGAQGASMGPNRALRGAMGAPLEVAPGCGGRADPAPGEPRQEVTCRSEPDLPGPAPP